MLGFFRISQELAERLLETSNPLGKKCRSGDQHCKSAGFNPAIFGMPRNTIFLLIHAPGLCLEAEATCYTFAQAAWKLRRSQRFGSTVIAVLSADNH
jgi:hypothetical protein